MTQGLHPEGMHLRDYLGVLYRRRWVLLSCVLAAVVAGLLVSFGSPALYKATVTIRIDRERPNVVSFKDIYPVERPEADYYQTQYRILRSRSLARRVIQMLSLAERGEFSPRPGRPRPAGLLGLLPWGQKADKAAAPHDGPLVDAFLQRLQVSPDRKSQLVRVSFVAQEPRLAQEVANAVAEAYIEFNMESKLRATQKARDWLREQIELMQARLEASEERLNSYAARHRMVFLPQGQDIMAQRLSELASALGKATAERIAQEALLAELRAQGAMADSPVLQGLKEQYAALKAQYQGLLDTYTPEYPQVRQMAKRLQGLREELSAERARLAQTAEARYQAALRKEQALREAFERQKAELLEFQQKTVQYRILQREVQTNKQLYDHLLQRLKELSVAATMTATNIQVLDRAELPLSPFKPRKGRNLLLALILGLLGGMGLAFFVEYFDNTVKDVEGVEQAVGLPVLGVVPYLQEPGDGSGAGAEAFSSVATLVQFSSASRPPQVVLVSSPSEQEGKTTVCTYTAKALAGTLGAGVVVDADLRRPMLQKLFALEGSLGLSTYLSGNAELSELLRMLPREGLGVIPAGPIPPNPSELLGSERMKALLQALRERYEFIFIDSAPLLGLSDSVKLSSFADGVVLVARAGQTPRGALWRCRKLLEYVNAKPLGVVLNGFRHGQHRYGYYYASYRSYHYGDKG